MATSTDKSTHRPTKVCTRAILGLLLVITGAAGEASASAIIIGPRIDLSPTTFALAIDIVDGVAVESWQFGLTYDASDVQVSTDCDPFSGDPYCSLLTGPVTEGDFFAGGAPFNLLIPGFVDLDPVTFVQTGRLFGVSGAFGGFPPFPSGNGTLAFVRFTILGDGSSDIEVDEPVITAVPEPGTLMLFTTGVLLTGVGRRFTRFRRR